MRFLCKITRVATTQRSARTGSKDWPGHCIVFLGKTPYSAYYYLSLLNGMLECGFCWKVNENWGVLLVHLVNVMSTFFESNFSFIKAPTNIFG